MTTLRTITLKCPCCKKHFKTSCVTSHNNCGSMSTDLYERAGGIQPLPHFIHTCPQCGYTNYDEGFDIKKIDKKLQQLIRENLRSFWKDERIPGYVKYDYAAQIAIWKNEREKRGQIYLLAIIWLHGSVSYFPMANRFP